MFFPFLWMVSTSLASDANVFAMPPRLAELDFSSYQRIFDRFPIGRWVINSFAVAGAATVLQVGTSAMAAYAFARLQFKGREILFAVYCAMGLAVLIIRWVKPQSAFARWLAYGDTWFWPTHTADGFGIGSVVLDGAVIGRGSVIGAGAVVSPGMVVPPHALVLGVPGKVVKVLGPESAEANRGTADRYVEYARSYRAK